MVSRLVQESVGVNKNVARIILKVIPRFKYQICTNFGLNKELYSGVRKELGDNRQGNLFVSIANRD